MKNLLSELTTAFVMAATALMATPLPALARNVDIDMNMSLLRQEKLEQRLREQTIQVAGEIEIQNGGIRIIDRASGKAYRISDNAELQKVYANGNRYIRIVGVMNGNGTLEARTIDVL